MNTSSVAALLLMSSLPNTFPASFRFLLFCLRRLVILFSPDRESVVGGIVGAGHFRRALEIEIVHGSILRQQTAELFFVVIHQPLK